MFAASSLGRRAVRALVPLVAIGMLTGCGAGASGAGVGQSEAGVDVPLPTIGLGSDTGSGRAVASDPAAIGRAVMIGDSITVGATPYLVEGFEAAGLPVHIGAQEGKRIGVSSGDNLAGTRLAEQFAGGAGSGGDVVWVVALGTNDIGQYATQADVEQQIRDLLAVVPATAPVVWINTWFRDRPEATTMVNDAIATVLAARGNAAVGDWSTVAPLDGVLRSDGVHPGDDGAKVFADLVVGATRDFLQR